MPIRLGMNKKIFSFGAGSTLRPVLLLVLVEGASAACRVPCTELLVDIVAKLM
jgi:hypothetical protein